MSGSAKSDDGDAPQEGSKPAQNDGVKSLTDFTKFITGVSGAGVAYIVSNANALSTGLLQKITATIAIVAFTASFVGGCMVMLGTAGMLLDDDFNFDDPVVRWPGLVNVLSAAVGALALAVIVLSAIW